METGERRAVWTFFLPGPTCQGSLPLTPNRLWMEGYTGHRKKTRGHTRVKASRPLIRVLVINENGLWINDFI